jgi:CheY-like chemotaxis protein
LSNNNYIFSKGEPTGSKMQNILLQEKESVIALDIQLLLKEYRIVRNVKPPEYLLEYLAREHFDLIMIDVKEPEKTVAVLESIKNNYNIPIIFLSTLPGDFLMPVQNYCSAVVGLPYNENVLISAVKSCVLLHPEV